MEHCKICNYLMFNKKHIQGHSKELTNGLIKQFKTDKAAYSVLSKCGFYVIPFNDLHLKLIQMCPEYIGCWHNDQVIFLIATPLYGLPRMNMVEWLTILSEPGYPGLWHFEVKKFKRLIKKFKIY